MLYRSCLASRAGFPRAIHLFFAALAACNGTLQFSSPEPDSGGAGGQAIDASSGGDASHDAPDTPAVEDAVREEGGGFAPPCHKDSDCPVSKLHCDIATTQCVECVGDVDCVVDPYTHCDMTVHRCVECVAVGDCGANALCDPTTRICLALCPDGGGCPAALPFCDARGICAQCRTNADCFRPDLCDTTIGRCAYCAGDQGCIAPNLRCDPYNPGRSRCKECLLPSDCPASAPYCDVHGGTCVAGP